jgi:hypothetical protein
VIVFTKELQHVNINYINCIRSESCYSPIGMCEERLTSIGGRAVKSLRYRYRKATTPLSTNPDTFQIWAIFIDAGHQIFGERKLWDWKKLVNYKIFYWIV